jgi:hypothetical protein
MNSVVNLGSGPRLHLVVQLYRARSEDLFRRMCECIVANLGFDFVSRVTIVSENVEININNPKVAIVRVDKRLAYKDLLEVAFSDSKGHFSHVAISNTDIFLTDALRPLFNKVTKKSTVVALSRQELDGRPHQNPKFSQDFWLFLPHKPDDALMDACVFRLGIAGCEHMFAMALYSHGYSIWNPSVDCIVRHNDPNPRHAFYERYQGAYLFLPPCKTEDVEERDPRYEISIGRREFREGQFR